MKTRKFLMSGEHFNCREVGNDFSVSSGFTHQNATCIKKQSNKNSNHREESKMATGTQPQTSQPPLSGDFAERLETHLTEVKHQGELKHQHSEPLAHGRLLQATIY
jgi:hypothetical protein